MLYIISEFSLELLFLLEMSLNTKAQTSRGDMTSFLETFCYETKIRGFFFFFDQWSTNTVQPPRMPTFHCCL